MEQQNTNRRTAQRVSAQSLNITGKLQAAGDSAENIPEQTAACFKLIDVSRVGYRLETAENPGLGSQVLLSFDQNDSKSDDSQWDLFDEVVITASDEAPCLGVVVWRRSVQSGYEVGIQVKAAD